MVNWRTCLVRQADNAENIEVQFASHLGLGVNAAVLWAVADRLAQPEGAFSPFARSGPFAFAYPLPEYAPRRDEGGAREAQYHGRTIRPV